MAFKHPVSSFHSFFPLSALSEENVCWGTNACLVYPIALDPASLEDAFWLVLHDAFPAFNGRVLQEPSSGRFVAVEGQRPQRNASFQVVRLESEALSDSVVANPRRLMRDPELHGIFPDARTGFGVGNPLVLVRVTLLAPCDYTIIAVTVSHAICDASTMHMFLDHWSRACTGRPRELAVVFRQDRPEMHSNAVLLNRLSKQIKSTVATDPIPNVGKLLQELQNTHKLWRFFLNGSRISELKQKLNSVLNPKWISTNEMIFAIIVMASANSRNVSGDILLQMIVDLRERSSLFSVSTAGNCFAKPLIKYPFHSESTNGTYIDLLAQVCHSFHLTVRGSLEQIELVEDVFLSNELRSRIPELSSVLYDSGYFSLLENYGFFLNSWNHRPWFDLSFDSANTKPTYMTNTPFYDFDEIITARFVHIIPSSVDGNIDLVVILTQKEIEAIGRLFQDLNILDIDPI